jgi:hypothetical protein
MSTALRALQSAMQRTIMTGFDAVAASDSAPGVSIYSTAYRLRLRDALAQNYPMLQTHLGTKSFTTVADAYLDAHPSTHVSVRVFGERLPEWLSTQRAQEPWLGELAEFEWALAAAFDAVDEPSLEIATFARIEPSEWARLTFRFARCVARLTLRTHAVKLYARAKREESLIEATELELPSDWLIWRQGLTSQYRSMTQLESCALDALRAGQTFGEACELMFELGESTSVPMHAAAFLKRWVTDGLICAVTIGD